MRFHAYVTPQFGRSLPGSAVQIEHGFNAVIIDNTCTYYVSATMDEPLPYGVFRTGTLSPSMAAALAAALPRGGLRSLRDCSDTGAPTDSPPLVLADEASSALCSGGFGPRFRGGWDEILRIWPALWESGQPMVGPVRASAVDVFGGRPIYPWPLAQPLDHFTLDGAELSAPGVSRLVDNQVDAAALRELRASHTRGDLGYTIPGSGITAADGDTVRDIFLRDALPHEDEHGRLPF